MRLSQRTPSSRNLKGFSRLVLGVAIAVLFGLSTNNPLYAAEETDSHADDKRPNIVLVMADDQGWGDVGYNGHPRLQTPVLDEMAATGLRFDRFYAAAPVCSPTRGSVLTGRHPNRFGCFSWGHTLRPQEVTVAEALRSAGYATGHFGKWHLGSVRADSPVSPGNSGFDEWFSSPNFYENSPLLSHRGRVVETEGEGSQVTVELAADFIRAAVDRDQPFLAVVWFGSPHSPHIALDEDREPYADLPARQQHFLGEITAMDRAIGNLREQLRELEIADNTLLWYTSDNGALKVGSTGGLSGGKGDLWEGGIRVPAMIEWPSRIPSPRTTDLPASSVDIYPTLLEVAGVTVDHQPPLDGISLLPLVDGTMTERGEHPLGFWVYPERGNPRRSHELLAELAREQAGQSQASPAPDRDAGDIAGDDSEDDFPGKAAWIDGRYKLHRIPAKNGGGAQYRLFDLEDDRREKHDLAEDHAERVQQMKRQLRTWQQSVIRSLNGDDYAGE